MLLGLGRKFYINSGIFCAAMLPFKGALFLLDCGMTHVGADLRGNLWFAALAKRSSDTMIVGREKMNNIKGNIQKQDE